MEERQQIGSYRIDREIATSSICIVYKGYDEKLDRTVLLKKLHSQMAREDDIRERFEREAKVCAQVKHENIVDIYGYESNPDLTMLVLEYVDGSNLAELISTKGPIKWQVVSAMLFAVLRGLAQAHSKGILHRDIKPENILISGEGVLKITDFGLASLEGTSKLTQQGIIVGTPAYMPPEQISGGQPDRSSDLFSVGATFYEALTGISPFQGESFSETMKKVLEVQLQPPSFVEPEIPREIDQLILRLLEKHPTKRYATAEQALDDLGKFVEREKLSIDRSTISGFLSLPGDPDAVRIVNHPSSSVVINPKIGERKTALATGIVGVIAILVILGVSLRQDAEKHEHDKVAESLIEHLANLEHNPDIKRNSPEIKQQRTQPQTRKDIEEPANEFVSTKPENEELSSDISDSQTDVPGEALESQGQVFITAKPWANITINNVYYGQTPLTEEIMLDPGSYEVTLNNDQFPLPVTERIEVVAGEELRLDIDLWSYFAVLKVVSVKPWAEIFIDGVSYGETPMAIPIIVPFGKHLVELKNPDFEVWQNTYEIGKGDPPLEITAVLK